MTVYQDALIFDLDEVKELRSPGSFTSRCSLPAFDPEGGTGSYWVRLDQLDFARVTMRADKPTVACPLDRALFTDMAYSFRDAFQEAIDQS